MKKLLFVFVVLFACNGLKAQEETDLKRADHSISINLIPFSYFQMEARPFDLMYTYSPNGKLNFRTGAYFLRMHEGESSRINIQNESFEYSWLFRSTAYGGILGFNYLIGSQNNLSFGFGADFRLGLINAENNISFNPTEEGSELDHLAYSENYSSSEINYSLQPLFLIRYKFNERFSLQIENTISLDYNAGQSSAIRTQNYPTTGNSSLGFSGPSLLSRVALQYTFR